MPIPYMGSKRKSAQKIYQSIINFNPKKGTIVDLFCGGFAISEKFLENGWNVISNDKNIYVVELLRKVIFEGLPEKIVTKFISREKFYDIQNNPQNYDAWYVGYVQCCWSFGNNQKNYLFGKEIEAIKHAGHELVINKNPDFILQILPNIPKIYIDGILKQDNWHKRRSALQKVSVVLQKRYLELQQLQQLELYSNDYFNIEIENNSIVYCDPPYEGTASYAEGGFNHSDFWEWCRKQSLTNDVFISEYKAPEDFISILKFSQKSTLQGGSQKHNNQPCENLFIHKSFYDRKFKLNN